MNGKSRTPMIQSDFVSFLFAKHNTRLLGLAVLKQTHIASAAFFPFIRFGSEAIQFASSAQQYSARAAQSAFANEQKPLKNTGGFAAKGGC